MTDASLQDDSPQDGIRARLCPLIPPEDILVRFDRTLIERMYRAGISSRFGRWELVDGLIVDACDPGRPHEGDAGNWYRTSRGNRLIPFDREILELMENAGILDDLGRCELEDGVMIRMSPSLSPHGKALSYLNALIVNALGDRFTLASDTMLFLKEKDMRAPDITVVPDETPDGFFEPKDVLLCIEIASASLDKDMTTKAVEYARHGIPEYWVVDLPNRLLHIHRAPGPAGYSTITSQGWEETVHPHCAPDVAIRPADQLDRVIR